MRVPTTHFVSGGPLEPQQSGLAQAMFGMGCFWGAEKMFWQTPGVVSTRSDTPVVSRPTPPTKRFAAVGPDTPRSCGCSSTRHESATRSCCACSGKDMTRRRACGKATTLARSTGQPSITTTTVNARPPRLSRDAYQQRLRGAGYGEITTEIVAAPTFYYAEGYHQQYLAKNPNGYCGHGGTGVACPIGLTASRQP